MKKVILVGVLITLWIIMMCISCTTKKEKGGAEMANQQNKETFKTKTGEKDTEFVVNTVERSFAEIGLAQLALTKSNDSQVKKIAGMLQKDHNKALRELKDLASKKGISIPMEESNEALEDKKELQKETQADFNKDWLMQLEGKHKKTIRDFETEWKDSEDEDLKSWISNTLPTLRNHLNMLMAYKDQVR